MNRPKLEYWNDGLVNHEWDYIDYLEELVNYCYELENALDKACEKLAFVSNEHIIEELGSFTLGEINRTKEQWKEWLLKDE